MKYKACKKCAASVGIINIFGNVSMILLKGYLGILGGSKALIADAIHSCGDLLATIVMIIGFRIVKKPKSEKYPYGFGKAEYIVACLIYIFLLLIGAMILYDALWDILMQDLVVPCGIAAWGALFSIFINELLFRQSVCVGTQINSPSMVAKAWESRSDVYSSIAVIVGILGARLGFVYLDPLAAIVVAGLIIKMSVEMLRVAVGGLMDKATDEETIKQVKRTINNFSEVKSIQNIRSRELGRTVLFDIELIISQGYKAIDGERIKNKIKQNLENTIIRKSIFNIYLTS